ncbi:unnamed protein product, partial [Prorocentrum cordatum]
PPSPPFLLPSPAWAAAETDEKGRGAQLPRTRQAQTILMAPAEAGDKHLQVDTSLFVEVGDEVQIDSGSGYSEKATVKESEQKMVLVLDQGLQHSYPAGSAVTTLPQDTPPR